ncbi:putative copper-exporting P-type ATPase A [Halalkalicoccus paucihalophilus]|uniref:Putative copper-exporting P-type ATPase A n=1 Tax=Halalkalicoccus paucihalophilus TaxID=1008153 RepID=A0A151ABE2_9EURY|nr:heavy metal translocating P-type ATPase [Halalkalicoccus paucihalophilus]KYH24822.1 putative copper-exporting P-type ATPase A [Halalkalicoccus paucihalophilus]
MNTNAPGSDDLISRTVRLEVPGMDCPSCAEKIVNSVSKLDGIVTVEPQVMTGTVHVEYLPETVGVDAVIERVQTAGYDVESRDDMETERFDVPTMDCASCAGKIENALDSTAGIQDRETLPTTGTVIVTYDPEQTSRANLVAAIESAGYEIEETGPDAAEDALVEESRARDVWLSPRALKTWVGGSLLLVGLAVQFLLSGLDVTLVSVLGRGFGTTEGLYFAGAVISGEQILRNGYYSARTRSLDIDLLMSLGIIGALTASVVFGEALYLEAGMLAVLFSIAELMEEYAMDRARSSLRELVDLSPTTATVRRDGEEITVPVEELRVGDSVIARPGDRIPADGTVVDGESAVNQAPITGESVPVDKTDGDEVYAGTINEEGYLEIEVTAAAEDSTLARIVKLVEDAQRDKTEHERFVDRFAGQYTPVIVTLAVLITVVPPLIIDGAISLNLAGQSVVFTGEWATWFKRGLALLVLSCPCALVISTPVSVVSGITSAAKNGVLIKGGTHLESVGMVGAVAFDKTGTLTHGELTVTDVVPAEGETRKSVLAVASSLEARSEHPIGEAIVGTAEAEGIDSGTVSGFESLTGKGVRADVEGEAYFVGKPALFEELGVSFDGHIASDGGVAVEPSDSSGGSTVSGETVESLQSEGKTVVLVGTEERLVGAVAVADEIRPEAKRMIERLHDLGVERVVMLTGDNEVTARAVGEAAGVDEVRAELLPEDKAEVVTTLDKEYGGVLMVGDGVNDAPALATATVGVAMGAAGTDTAVESADVALMADDLSKLPYLYALSGTANGVIRQNIWASIGVKALLAVGVPFGLVNVAVAIIVGDMGMSLGVTTNALRLAGIKPDRFE